MVRSAALAAERMTVEALNACDCGGGCGLCMENEVALEEVRGTLDQIGRWSSYTEQLEVEAAERRWGKL
jgi:hypothetical protein